VKVVLVGYLDAEQTVAVVAGETVNADFVLTVIPPETGSIKVTSDPTGAGIWIDGVDTVQTTEATIGDLAPGDHTVKVTLAGYQDDEQTVAVIAGATVNADFILTAIPPETGSILVTSDPLGAEIWIDGVDTGLTTEATLDNIAAGDHTVKVTLAGYEDAEQMVSVITGETANADFTLLPLAKPPKAQFLAFPRQGTAPLSVIFLDISRGSPTSREWDFGDGATSTDLFPIHTYSKPGKYTVKLTVSNSGGSDTMVREDFITVRGENPPNAQFIAYPQHGTAPLTVLFLDLSRGSPTSRVWDFGDGNTSSELFPIHTYDKPGTYAVKLTVSNSGGSDTMVREDFITARAENPPTAQFIAFPQQGTAPLSVLFLDISSGSVASREWDFGDGSTSSDLFPIHTYDKPGKYTVKIMVSNSGGSNTMVREDFITVTAGSPPQARFAAYPWEGTAPLAVTFLDLSLGYPSSRQWDFGDGATSTDENPVHTYAEPGKYTVTLTVVNDAGTDTLVQENFINVAAVKVTGMVNQEAGTEADEPEKTVENASPSSGSNDRPMIKIS
jgi:PKD repeat protein